MVSIWAEPESVVINGQEPLAQLINVERNYNTFSETELMMLLDGLSYLPDDILVKFDRAAMSVSLETRIHFLDHRIADFAWSLPQHFKLRNGQTKWILRQILGHYIPHELSHKPKMGILRYKLAIGCVAHFEIGHIHFYFLQNLKKMVFSIFQLYQRNGLNICLDHKIGSTSFGLF